MVKRNKKGRTRRRDEPCRLAFSIRFHTSRTPSKKEAERTTLLIGIDEDREDVGNQTDGVLLEERVGDASLLCLREVVDELEGD